MNLHGRPITAAICAFGLVMLLAPGCGENETTTETITSQSAGALVRTTGCKSLDSGSEAALTAAENESCIRYQYDGQGVLSLKHVNAGFNCCPIIAADVSVDDNTITIEERETLDHGGCECLCLFDLDFEIDNVSPGMYTIDVVELYLVEGDERLVFDVDLAATPEGERCVQRNHYPWGQ